MLPGLGHGLVPYGLGRVDAGLGVGAGPADRLLRRGVRLVGALVRGLNRGVAIGGRGVGAGLLAMIKEAPTALGFQLWDSAMELPVRDVGLPGPDPQVSPEPEPEPGPATRGLAETYERYADELAAIEAIRSQRSA